MIKFIGSVYFALILIATVAIVVIAGTFLESITNSHLFAAQLTYGNPLFAVLLWLFFINILVSTLLRWPFKKQHIPFIITHMGLLMILAGQLVKHYYGTQGVMHLAEGCSTCEYFSEHSQALQLTDRDGKITTYPIKNFKIDAPDVRIVSYHPNASESLQGWIFEGNVWVNGLPPIPVQSWAPDAPLPRSTTVRLHHATSIPWNLYAVKTEHVDLLVNQLSSHQPYVLFLDREIPEILWVSAGGSQKRHSLDPNGSVAMYDRGFGGYTTTIEIPFPNFLDTADAHRDALVHALTLQLRMQKDEHDHLSPPLKLFYNASENAEVPFVDTAIAFLDEWDRSGDYLFIGAIESADLHNTIEKLDRSEMLNLIRQVAPEVISYSDRLSTAGLFSICCKAFGLELQKMSPPDKDQLLREYYAACFYCNQVKSVLPKLSKWSLDEKVSFLQSFPIDAEQLVGLRKAYLEYLQAASPDLQLPEEYTPSLREIVEGIRLLTPLKPPKMAPIAADFTRDNPRLESPLFPVRKAEAESVKMEEHRPIATFEMGIDAKERFTLVYDPYGTGLQWPISNGQLLARFQPDFQKLPHTLKLRQARQINYANSSQPYSYEADLWIEPEHSLVSLSMNRVHETSDGTRFYLSGISPTDSGAWKKIQVVINKDPGKYWLTYSGAFILVLGALLLYLTRLRTSR